MSATSRPDYAVGLVGWRAISGWRPGPDIFLALTTSLAARKVSL